MKYRIFLDSHALRDFNSIPEPDHSYIHERLQRLKQGFLPDLDIRKLKGYKNTYRLRAGTYRRIFELNPDYEIIVIGIRPRKSAYR
jgi:mRNA interferase RelE/StbE